MKEKLYTTLIGFCVFAYTANADITNIYGGETEDDAVEIKADGVNIDVVLNPGLDASYFKANNNTIGSLSTSGESFVFNIIGDDSNGGKTIIDINKEGDGEVSALTNNGTINLGKAAFEIVNSAGSSAVANINLGTMTLNPGDDSFGSVYGLFIKTNANISGMNFYSKNSEGNFAVNISDNVNVVWSVNAEFNGKGITIGKNSTFTTDKKLTFNKGSSLKVNGNFIANYENILSVYNLELNGTLTTKYRGLDIYGSSNINGILNLSGNFYNNGQTTIKAGSKIIVGRDKISSVERGILLESGRLFIDAENAFSTENGDLVNLMTNYYSNFVFINADNKFAKLVWLDSTSTRSFTLTVANDAHVYFESLWFKYNHGGKLYVEKFVENSIFFKDISEWENLSIEVSSIDGQKYAKDDLFLIAGNYIDGTEGYWLSVTPIPEPAECAAIFGALVLALAAYNRRKQGSKK